MSTPEPRPRPRPDATGFSTRAIRAASRAPKVEQTPTSVPIYQTATVEGGREAGRAIIDAMTLSELTASLGSVHTMVVHPPSTSHRQSTEAELLDAGITPGLLRVSVGLEDLEDLEADFSAALAAAAATLDGRPVPALGAV